MSELSPLAVDHGILSYLATLPVQTARDFIEQFRIDHAIFDAPGTPETYAAIRALLDQGQPIHALKLQKSIASEPLRRLGGFETLVKLCDMLNASKLPPLGELTETAQRRQISKRAKAAAYVISAAVSVGDLESARQAAERFGSDIQTAWSDEIFHVSEVASRIQTQAEGRLRGEIAPSKIETRIPALDTALAGGLPKNLIVIGAEGGRGKSGLAIRIAQLMAQAKTTVGYLSLEDAAETLITRLVDDHSAVNLSPTQFHSATTSEHLDNVHTALSEISTLPLWMSRHGRVSAARLLSLVDSMRHRGAQVVFVDNSNEVSFGANDDRDRHRAVDDVLGSLREWAQRWGVPVVFVTHLTRDPRRNDKQPIQRGDFAHSAGFERIARCMLGVRQLQDNTVMAIDCVKLSEGRSGWSVLLKMSQKAGVPTTEEAPPPPKPVKKKPAEEAYSKTEGELDL